MVVVSLRRRSLKRLRAEEGTVAGLFKRAADRNALQKPAAGAESARRKEKAPSVVRAASAVAGGVAAASQQPLGR